MEEAARLKELVEEEEAEGSSSHPDWDRIAARLGTGRLAWQCCSHYQATFNRRLQKSGPIVGEEAEEIVRIIEAYQCAITGRIDWRNVAALVEGRTLNQVQYFHRKRLRPTVVRPWLRLEDKVLLAGVKLFGDGSWSRIAQYLPLRNNRQVRQRYKSQLEFAFSSGSGTGTGTGGSSITTTGHCAQRRKFGAWIAAEDELILKMSQSYTKVAKGRDGGEERRLIDIPLITRMYFPNRNVSQVYRRYHYLTRFISLAEHGKPSSSFSSSSTSMPAAAAEDEDDSCGVLMAELQKVTRKRQRDRKSAFVSGRLAARLPDGKEALGRFLLKGKQKLAKLLKREQFDVVLAEAEEDLKEESTEEDEEEEAEDEEREDVEDEAEDIAAASAPPFPTTTYQLVIKKEDDEDEDENEGAQDWNDAQQTHLEYDQIFRTLHRLNGLRKAANGVMFTALDLNANELLKTALTEMIDPDVEENLQLSLLPAANADPQADYSVASLDTMRYFLSTVAGCTLTRGEGPEKDSAAAHSTHCTTTTTLALLPPNSSTAFGWALLQVMTRALMCRLAEEPEEAVEEERREEVRGSEEFAEARSIFRSLFTWPALLASPPLARDERITEELRRGRTDQTAEGAEEEGGEGNTEDSPEVPAAAECSQSLAVVQPAKRPRGRPRKRTFYFDSAGIDFVRVRAHQAALFLTLHQSDLLGRLHQAAAPDGYFSLLRRQQGKHWPTEAREHLRERVKRFLDAVWSTVDGRLAVKEAQKEKGKGKKKRRTREPGEAEGQKKTTSKQQQQQQPNTTADEQVVPVRRSTRGRIPKQGPQED